MIDHSVRMAIMQAAIAEADLSQPEDDRVHPKVGALLVGPEHQIVLRAHRNEIASCNPEGLGGDHAERVLLHKAHDAKLELQSLILVVTLEPCTHRGPEKTACALRVALSGIPEVWFGSLDPDPRIRGAGEEILRRRGLRVERFPHDLVETIRHQSAPFVNQFRQHYEMTTLRNWDFTR